MSNTVNFPFLCTEIYFEQLPYVILGTLAILSAIAAFFLPETYGKPLPQNIQDMSKCKRWVYSVVTLEKFIKIIKNILTALRAWEGNVQYEVAETKLNNKLNAHLEHTGIQTGFYCVFFFNFKRCRWEKKTDYQPN